MKKILLGLIVLTLGLTSCSVSTSDNINVDGEDMTYFKDSRTGLCFGAVASSKPFDASSSGLGVACVPCKEVEHLIK